MSVHSRIALQLLALCLTLGAVGFAADATPPDASLYVVHGIPGRVVSADVNPGFPVDVLLNDQVCTIHGLAFTGSIGPLTLPPGDYDIKISPANTLAPCTNSPQVETTVKLPAGGAATGALALSNGTPALLTFADNLKTVTAGQGRVIIANAADAGTLDLALTSLPITKTSKTRKFTLAPGAETTLELPIGGYSLVATASGGTTPLVTGIVIFDNQSTELVYFVGSPTDNSVTLVTRLIRDVF